jgi:hypothetical protein
MGENISGSTCGASHRAGRRSRKRHDGSARGGAWILRTFRRRAVSRRQRLITSYMYAATPWPSAYPPRTDNRADKRARVAASPCAFLGSVTEWRIELRFVVAPSYV